MKGAKSRFWGIAWEAFVCALGMSIPFEVPRDLASDTGSLDTNSVCSRFRDYLAETQPKRASLVRLLMRTELPVHNFWWCLRWPGLSLLPRGVCLHQALCHRCHLEQMPVAPQGTSHGCLWPHDWIDSCFRGLPGKETPYTVTVKAQFMH